MSFKYPKNVIVVVSIAAALLAGTVLLGGYSNSKSADTQAPARACKVTGSGCCPMMAGTSGCPKMMAAQTETESCSGTSCTMDCPKPCCAEEGCCDNPCPIPCPKPCCAEGGCCGAAGCPMTAAETKVQ